ncbi:MAG: hypothetical protein IPO22_02385 [Anaerolineales bacterium]|nr:hypothetical protein [Anaerolineales bacterium]
MLYFASVRHCMWRCASGNGSARPGRLLSPSATEAPAAAESSAFSPQQNAQSPSSQQPYDMFFQDYGVNPSIDTEDDNLSTFALDVDTGRTPSCNYWHDGNLPSAGFCACRGVRQLF